MAQTSAKNSFVVAYIDSLDPKAAQVLSRRPNIEQVPFPHLYNRDKFQTVLRDNPHIHAVILGAQPVSTPELELMSDLRVVARLGVGFDAIDIPALAPRRIPLMVTGIANSPSVAEQAFHMMFTLIKRSRDQDRVVRDGRWAERMADMPGDIFEKTLLVIGFGRIGSRVVKRALAMEMNVLVYDPYVAAPQITAAGATPVSKLDDALPLADVVSIHCPRSPETLGLIDAKRIGMMRPTAVLINTARGGLVDETALLDALRHKRIAGAGLDVLEKEPPPTDHPLFAMANVVFAPHMAGVTVGAVERMSMAAVENILSVFDGNIRRENVINREVLAG